MNLTIYHDTYFQMWNAEKWSYKDGMEAFYVILLLLAREPKTQIAGVTLIADFSGMTRKHIATDLEDIKAWVNLISVSYDKKPSLDEKNVKHVILFYVIVGWCTAMVSSFSYLQCTQSI